MARKRRIKLGPISMGLRLFLIVLPDIPIILFDKNAAKASTLRARYDVFARAPCRLKKRLSMLGDTAHAKAAFKTATKLLKTSDSKPPGSRSAGPSSMPPVGSSTSCRLRRSSLS